MRTSVADKKFTRLNTNFLTKNLPYSLKGKFQTQALRRCGHCVTSNAPKKVSKKKNSSAAQKMMTILLSDGLLVNYNNNSVLPIIMIIMLIK